MTTTFQSVLFILSDGVFFKMKEMWSSQCLQILSVLFLALLFDPWPFLCILNVPLHSNCMSTMRLWTMEMIGRT